MESGLTQSLKSTKLWYCQPSYMHVRPGQYTNAMPKDLTSSTYAAKHQVAKQDPGLKGPEEGGDAKRAYSIEACTAWMDLPCHKNV